VTDESGADTQQFSVVSDAQASAMASAQQVQDQLDAATSRIDDLNAALSESEDQARRVQTEVEELNVAVATVQTTLRDAVEQLAVASTTSDAAASAAQVNRLADQMAVAGLLEGSSGRLLVWQQAPAWALGIGVLGLAFYLVYARISTAGPWIAVAVGLIIAVVLAYRTKLEALGAATKRATPADPD
jgi:TolA-binding protein